MTCKEMKMPPTKMNKRKFQSNLYKFYWHNWKNVYSSLYDEFDYATETNKRMTLYYMNGNTDKHIGTWMSGKGWIF